MIVHTIYVMRFYAIKDEIKRIVEHKALRISSKCIGHQLDNNLNEPRGALSLKFYRIQTGVFSSLSLGRSTVTLTGLQNYDVPLMRLEEIKG